MPSRRARVGSSARAPGPHGRRPAEEAAREHARLREGDTKRRRSRRRSCGRSPPIPRASLRSGDAGRRLPRRRPHGVRGVQRAPEDPRGAAEKDALPPHGDAPAPPAADDPLARRRPADAGDVAHRDGVRPRREGHGAGGRGSPRRVRPARRRRGGRARPRRGAPDPRRPPRGRIGRLPLALALLGARARGPRRGGRRGRGRAPPPAPRPAPRDASAASVDRRRARRLPRALRRSREPRRRPRRAPRRRRGARSARGQPRGLPPQRPPRGRAYALGL